MKIKPASLLCLVVSGFFVFSAFSPSAYSSSALNQSDFINSDSITIENNGDLKIFRKDSDSVELNALSDDIESGVNTARHSLFNAWSDFAEQTKDFGNPAIKRATVALSSNSRRSITISVTLCSNGKMRYLGFESLRLQRYYKGRWLTVYTADSRIAYNTSRFSYTETRSSLVSQGSYRAIVNFIAGTCGSTVTVSKTTGTIRCR